MAGAELFDRLCLRLCIRDKGVEGNNRGNTEFLNILDVLLQVDDTFLQGLDILFLEFCLGNAAVIFESLDACYDDNRVGMQVSHAALDVKELLSAEVSAESRLSDRVVGDLDGSLCRADRVAAVRDVGEGTAVNKSRGVLNGLDQVGGDGFFEEGHHGTGHFKSLGKHGFALIIVADHDAVKTLAEVFPVLCKTENCHDFGSRCDDKAILAKRSVHLGAHADDDVAQGAVIHVHAAFPDDPGGIDAQSVSVMNMVVNSRCQQVVGRSDGVEITCKMQVELLHGKYLGIAAAGSAALDAEAGPQRRLAQSQHDTLSKLVESVRHAYAGSRFSFTRRGGVDGCHQDQFSVRTAFQALQILIREFCLILSIQFQRVRGNSRRLGNLSDRKEFGLLCDLDICLHFASSLVRSRFLSHETMPGVQSAPGGLNITDVLL